MLWGTAGPVGTSKRVHTDERNLMARTARTAAIVTLVRALRGVARPGEPGLRERLACVPRLLRATASGGYTGTSRARLATLAAAVLYVVSPIDLLPEVVLGPLGLADDALVISWIAATLLGETDAYLRWERARARRSPSGRQATSARQAKDDVVPGHVVR